MQRTLAALLLICVGILIPASAAPVRICFMELGLNTYQEFSKCCIDCSQESEVPDPCCHDLEELPEAIAPQFPAELPAAVITEMPVHHCLTPVTTILPLAHFPTSAPIRGPTSPAAFRAVLSIWRL